MESVANHDPTSNDMTKKKYKKQLCDKYFAGMKCEVITRLILRFWNKKIYR